jgi:RNA-directed DNA polymerase
MIRYGHLYERIYSMENLKLAHKNARKGKGWYEEVKEVDANEERYLTMLQDMLINKTYRTSEYMTFMKTDGTKTRKIYKLPYFPDRICQWAILQVIEPFLIKNLTADTYSAIPKRGIHAAFRKLKHAMQTDVVGCQYCLKLDAKKYYPSINHNILKQKFRRKFKDGDLLWLLDEIIDSISTVKIEDMRNIWLLDEDIDLETGIPIGNYFSQYAGNFYFSSFDHWIKEVKRIKHYFRYMDDIVIFGQEKSELHALRQEIMDYFRKNLKLTIKENWQIFPTYVRGVDFVGYRTFLNYTLLRKSTCKQFKSKMLSIRKKVDNGKEMNYSEWCSINSYKGWLKHCDSYQLTEKYITPIQEAADQFYLERVKRK